MAPDGKTVLHRPAAGWIAGLFATLLIGSLCVAFAILSVAFLVQGKWLWALGIGILAAWMYLFTNYVWHDFQAKRAWRIEIEPGEMLLDLPAHRSLMGAGLRDRRFMEISAIDAIETRLEAFRSFGMGNMQRNYALHLKSGEIIVLGEDRALTSGLDDHTMGHMVGVIALKTGLPLRDLGMVEGTGGLLGVLCTSVPRWDTPSLPPVRRKALLTGAAITGSTAFIIVLVGYLLAAIL
nr:hypothetical protein [uncultured Hyphomonas sp.]